MTTSSSKSHTRTRADDPPPSSAVTYPLEEMRVRTENERAQQQLQLQATALEMAANAVVITDANGVIQWVNPAFGRISGYDPAEVIGRHTRILKSGKHDQAFYEKLWNTLLAGKTWRGAFINRRKDRSLYQTEHTISPVRDSNGTITHFVAIMNDVTARKRAEQNLTESLNFLRTVLKESPVGIIAYDVDGMAISANPAAARLVGATVEQLESQNFRHIDSWRKSGLLESAEQALSTGQIQEFEVQMDTTFGKNVRFCWRFVPFAYMERQHLLAVFSDVGEYRRVELAMRNSDARFKTIFRSAPAGIVITTVADGRIIDANDLFCEEIGTPRDCLIGKTVVELGLWQFEERAAFIARLRKEGSIRGAEMKFQLQSGEVKFVIGSFVLFELERESEPVLISFYTDITEKKKLEAQFLRAQRLESIGTLASGVAHDLNNVLAPILMASEVLLAREKDAETRKMLSTIQTSANRGAGVVSQVLTFARGIEGKPSSVKPRYLIRELAQMLRSTLPKSITISTVIAPEVWPITGDITQLHQVLLNLSVNARDAMPEGGKLSLIVENFTARENDSTVPPGMLPGRFVLMKVADTGTGMSKEILPKIFEPFFTTKQPGKGTGLGLSTVVGIVRAHGGFLDVWSEPGKGTTFLIYFPVASEESAEIEGPGAAIAPAKGELVLVVDDESAICKLLKQMLESHGYNVMTASDGMDALSLYAENSDRIQVVLTDFMMPNLDGANLVRILQKMNPEVKIILCTGAGSSQGQTGRAGDLKAMNVNGYLTKPFSRRDVLKTLQQVIEED